MTTSLFQELEDDFDGRMIDLKRRAYLSVAAEVKMLAQEYKEHGLEKEATTAFCIYQVLKARVEIPPLPELK